MFLKSFCVIDCRQHINKYIEAELKFHITQTDHTWGPPDSNPDPEVRIEILTRLLVTSEKFAPKLLRSFRGVLRSAVADPRDWRE